MLDGFQVHGGESADVEAELFKGAGVEFLAFGADGGLLAHDDLLCGLGVGGEQTPVHVASVAEVRVVGFFGAPF